MLLKGGLALVEGPAESSSGVIGFPETGTNKAVLCVEQLSNRGRESLSAASFCFAPV